MNGRAENVESKAKRVKKCGNQTKSMKKLKKWINNSGECGK